MASHITKHRHLFCIETEESLSIVVALTMSHGERKNGMKNCTFVSAAKMIRCHALLGLRGIIIEGYVVASEWRENCGKSGAASLYAFHFSLSHSTSINSLPSHRCRFIRMKDDHCERVTGCGRTGRTPKPKSCDKRLNFQEGRFDMSCGHKNRDDNGGSLFEHVAECSEKVSRRKKKFWSSGGRTSL